MSKVIRVRYENGVLKPVDKLELREGEEVIIKVHHEDIIDLPGILVV